MIDFHTTVLKFNKKGEKTGWSYIEIPASLAKKLKPGNRVSFRVKGFLDQHPIHRTALLPMGEGSFILPINAALRKATGKKAGDKLRVRMEVDARKLTLSPIFVKCLKAEPAAYEYFSSLPLSHQHYFSKWIESAKTVETKSRRITQAVLALANKQGYGEMIRANKRSAFN